MARRSIIALLGGGTVDTWWIVAVAIAVATIALAWRAALRRSPLLFATLFVVGVAFQLQLNARLQSDGFYYYAYLRSLVFDRDVEFSNDYRMLGLGDKTHLFHKTRTGHAQSAWTIGPSILWAPFFAAAHPVAVRLNASGADVSLDGVSYPYRQAVCIAGLIYGLLGCWFCYRLTALYFDRRLAAAATTCVVCGSFMLWYLVKEPSMTHAPSMALVAGFTWMWAATQGGRTRRQWALLGALAGLMTLVRWQNAIFALLAAYEAAQGIWTARRTGNAQTLRSTIVAVLVFTAAAAAAFLPQMLAWRAIYGSFLAVSPVGPQIRLGDPQLVDVLWSSRNGLLSMSPILYCAAIGLVIFAVRSKRSAREVPHETFGVGFPMLVAVALMTYFNASVQDWWGSAGFGGRRFDGTIPFFCIGLAALAAHGTDLVRRFPAAALGLVGAALVVWNLTLMSTAQAGILRLGEAVSFGEIGAAQTRVFHRWFGHPFTYPVSLAFALRNRVSPGDYDLLAANRFLGDPLRQYGRVDVGAGDEWLLGDGWHQAEQDGQTTFRWTTSDAEVRIPLDHTAPLNVQVRLHAFGYPGAQPQTLTLVVNGRAQPAVLVGADWHVTELPVAADAWRSGVNRVRLVFAWAQRPNDVQLGGDTRPLAAAVDYVRVQVL